MSPEMRKKATPVCFGEGCVRDGVEDDEADPSSSATGSFSSPGAVEKPPEYTNSGGQLARLERGKSSRRRGLRRRGTWSSPWAFIEGQGKPEESGALPELMCLMDAV